MSKKLKTSLLDCNCINGYTRPDRKSGLSLTGFTLLEMLFVIVIVAIIVTVASPRFHQTLTTIQLANTTQDIAQLMRFLRTKAMSEKGLYQLKFDLSTRKYYTQKLTTGTTGMLDTSRLIPEGINITATLNPIKFYPDGSLDKVEIFLFKGKGEFYKDMEKAINKDFELGQVQAIAHTEYIYAIRTEPNVGRVRVTVPK